MLQFIMHYNFLPELRRKPNRQRRKIWVDLLKRNKMMKKNKGERDRWVVRPESHAHYPCLKFSHEHFAHEFLMGTHEYFG